MNLDHTSVPPLIVVRGSLKYTCIAMLIAALAWPIYAQTYKVEPGGTTAPESKGSPSTSAGQSLGFGSNIQNARLAHGAVQALERGDHALAVDYAQRAAKAAPNDAQLWFLLGYAARLDGKYPLSADAYSRGLRLKPSALDGLSGLAQTYSLMGRTAEAERLLKQVLSTDPNRRDAALLLGNLFMKSGDYTGALDWLNRAERVRPDANSELLLAISYQHLKQMDMARHYLQLARQRAPENPDVQRSLAGYYREVGNYPEAIAALKSIRNPKPDVQAELAYTYQLDGKLDESARLYVQAANALPRDLGLQLSAAQAQVAAGSIADAQPFLQRAATLNADSYRLHAIRGDIAQREERESDAIEEYNTALTHLPANPIEGPLYGIQIHMNLLDLYRSLNDESAAQRQLETAQKEIGALNEQGPDRMQFLRLRARIKLNAGEFDSALNDIKAALAISPHDPNNLQLDGDLLVKLGHTEDAISVYKQVLSIDPKNRPALTSLGYASRAAGRDSDAEKYFRLLARDYPSLYVPHLALGDLYTARGEYKKAETSYAKGYALAPKNALLVAGGMNAAIEAHDLPLAGIWLDRVTDKMKTVPQVLREKERYFNFKGEYQRSADIGREAIKVLPRDRDVVVYLGYDLLHLEQYDELLALTTKYMDLFPHEPDIPLLAGHVRRHRGELQLALKDFTTTLDRNPNVVTAYVNRGYVLNDLGRPDAAASDFQEALKLEQKNGVAHLGLAYAYLSLNRSRDALLQAALAEKELGDSKPIHVIRATAYGREGLLTKAATEYRAALKFDPNDGTIYLGLANTLYAQRRYREAIDELQTAQKFLTDNTAVYALLARTYAHLQDRERTLHYVQLAETHAQRTQAAGHSKTVTSETFLEIGEALSTLGEQKAAMERFQKALAAPNSNRVGVRLAIAKLMAQQDHAADAERQIALALMEAQAGETAAPTGEQYVGAASIFQQIHEYRLALSYLHRARQAGASDITVRVAAANSYLALGDTRRAAAELAAVQHADESEADYAYLLAEANVHRQEHQHTLALSAFAQAASAAGENQAAEQGLLQTGASEGFRINRNLSVLTDFIVQPIFEDSTVYLLDAKTFGSPPPVVGGSVNELELPRPRSSIETQWTGAYHLHLGALPAPGGFFQVRNARGMISDPATRTIVNRNTTDYVMNFSLNPTVHVGNNALTFSGGIAETLRRDSNIPAQLNQNLFRVFAYMSTSSFFNLVSVDGYFIREAGPFTESPISSRSLTGALDFRVGAPWSKTALVTGWGATDQQFQQQYAPSLSETTENYFTSSYIGLTHRFGTRLHAKAIVEDLRSWRVVPSFTPPSQITLYSGTAQALRVAGTVNFAPTPHWDIEMSTAYDNTRSVHLYDMTQNGLAVSYTRPFGRTFNDASGEIHVKYPIRFSAGVQQETFPNFPDIPSVPNLPYLTRPQPTQFRPYVSIRLF